MNLRKLFRRKRAAEVEDAPLFNRWTLKVLARTGVEPVDAGRPRAGDYVWVRYEGDTYLGAYVGASSDGTKALVGVLHPYTDENGHRTHIPTPRVLSMSDIARTGHSRMDVRVYHDNGRWTFVMADDEDTRPMEVIR